MLAPSPICFILRDVPIARRAHFPFSVRLCRLRKAPLVPTVLVSNNPPIFESTKYFNFFTIAVFSGLLFGSVLGWLCIGLVSFVLSCLGLSWFGWVWRGLFCFVILVFLVLLLWCAFADASLFFIFVRQELRRLPNGGRPCRDGAKKRPRVRVHQGEQTA